MFLRMFSNKFFLPTLALSLSMLPGLVLSQTPPPPAQPSVVLPKGASAKLANDFLATLRPPTSVGALLSGNDLLFEIPDVAAAGLVRIKLVSTMPRTDGLWLLSLSRQPETGESLITAMTLGPAALPEVNLLVDLLQTQPVLLVARAGGKYYGLQREIKIGQPATAVKKP